MGQGDWLQARSNAGGAALPCWAPGRSARVAPASTTARLHRRAVEAPHLGWAWSHHWPLPTFGGLFAAPWVQPPVPRHYCAGVVALAMASVWASSLVCDQCGSDSSRDGLARSAVTWEKNAQCLKRRWVNLGCALSLLVNINRLANMEKPMVLMPYLRTNVIRTRRSML
ncbi:hypothetical protein EJB05_51190, partial [Eragrostis curvula]